MSTEPSPVAIDAGADFLRRERYKGFFLKPWLDLPDAAKHKWRVLAKGVLRAAEAAIGKQEGGAR